MPAALRSHNKDKVFVSTMLSAIVPTLGSVAPALLITGMSQFFGGLHGGTVLYQDACAGGFF